MVIFLYSDRNCEHQAINCIKSLTHKITDGIKIVYYTIGFESEFEFKNLHKIRIEIKPEYPTFHFYKSELSLLTMQLFPKENYIFTDTDVLFSKRFDFNKTIHIENYPIASYGPFEYPYLWEAINGSTFIYNETPLMKYFNVDKRTQRYVWSCFYSFNTSCKDFFEEYTSICKNKYLMDKRKENFPYADETAFNICLWKRNAVKNYGFAFVNTHRLSTVIEVEEGVSYKTFDGATDVFGKEWEYVVDAKNVMLYHGFKEKQHMEETVNYLLNS